MVEAVVTAAGVVAVTVPVLLLNVVQSAADNAPRLVADADGKLNVCTVPAAIILKSDPFVPVANVCAALVNPFNEVMVLPVSKFENNLVVTLPRLSVVTIFVLVVLVPIPSNLTSFVECNCAVGVAVPMPMLPVFLL